MPVDAILPRMKVESLMVSGSCLEQWVVEPIWVDFAEAVAEAIDIDDSENRRLVVLLEVSRTWGSRGGNACKKT
jgi:hypothetical protein